MLEVVAMLLCTECGNHATGPSFCGYCAVPLRLRCRPTREGERARDLAEEREHVLASHATRTLEVNNALVPKLLLYLENEDAHRPMLFQVTPQDAVGWLTRSGPSGFTPVHVGSCPHWDLSRNNAPCDCPKYKMAATLRKEVCNLQGTCRRAGLSAQWCPLRRAGNPFTAPQVATFLEVTEREQTAGGVGAVQAALVDESVSEVLMRAAQLDWLRKSECGSAGASHGSSQRWALLQHAVEYGTACYGRAALGGMPAAVGSRGRVRRTLRSR